MDEAIDALFAHSTPELTEQSKRVKQVQPRIVEWLRSSARSVDAFTQDPIGALSKQFLEVRLEPKHQPVIPDRVRFVPATGEGVDSVVTEIFRRVCEHLATTEANTQAFRENPLSAIASIGAAYPSRGKRDQLRCRKTDALYRFEHPDSAMPAEQREGWVKASEYAVRLLAALGLVTSGSNNGEYTISKAGAAFLSAPDVIQRHRDGFRRMVVT